jgi:hypothetical protein
MKTRIILLLMICAVATLSFTFGSKAKAIKSENRDRSSIRHHTELKGGFVSEDKF